MNLLVAVILAESRETADEDDEAQTSNDWDTARSKQGKRSLLDGPLDAPPIPSPRSTKWPEHYALLFFGPRNPVRRSCQAVTSSVAFDRFIMAAILVSSACLAVDTPRLDPTSSLKAKLADLDLFFVAVFTVEMLLKLVALGACGQGACESSRMHHTHSHPFLPIPSHPIPQTHPSTPHTRLADFSNVWNHLDFAIVSTMLLSMLAEHLPFLRPLRIQPPV